MCDCVAANVAAMNPDVASETDASTERLLISRRELLLGGLSAAAMTALPFSDALAATAKGASLALNIKNQRTGEALTVAWLRNGQVDKRAIWALHLLTRDWREKRAAQMDLRLYLILSYIQHSIGLDKQIVLTSGYRTSETNSKIKGAALNSYHLRGQALDFTIPGVPTNLVRDMAVRMNLGGVGYYPSRNYVHIDTGPVRKWQA